MSLTLLLTNRMLIITALTVIRPIAAGMATPFFGGNLIQGSMKRAVSITVALIAIPRVSMDASAGLPSDAIELAVIIVKEVFLGFTWGFAAAKSYNVALTVGAFIDNQRGATIANVINPATSEESSLFGDMFLYFAPPLSTPLWCPTVCSKDGPPRLQSIRVAAL